MTPPSSDSCNCCNAAKAHVIRRCRVVDKGRMAYILLPSIYRRRRTYGRPPGPVQLCKSRGELKECPFVSLIKYPFSGHNFIWCPSCCNLTVWFLRNFIGTANTTTWPTGLILILSGEISGRCGKGQLHAHLGYLRISAELASLLFSFQYIWVLFSYGGRTTYTHNNIKGYATHVVIKKLE